VKESVRERAAQGAAAAYSYSWKTLADDKAAAIAGMRDVLIHAYHELDLEEVWRILTGAVPGLVQILEPLVPPIDGERAGE